MVKAVTEQAVDAALKQKVAPLTSKDVQEICDAVGCSRATFYRSEAHRGFIKGALNLQVAPATTRTKETMTKLRDTVKLLANCVQILALRVEKQDQELAALRRRANDNVTLFSVSKLKRH